MANESALRQRIGQLLREHGYFVQAIESSTNPGMPDMYYRLNKQVCGWIELKHIKNWPKRNSTSLFRSLNHPLLTEQENWFNLELRHGGRADIIVAYERRYFLVPGIYADVFNDLTPDTLEDWEVKKENIPSHLEDPDFYKDL